MNGDSIQIEVPKSALVEAFLEKMARASAPGGAAQSIDITRLASHEFLVGAAYHGGKYAGLTLHDNTPMRLVLLPGEFKGSWEKAKAWAAEQGGVLPSRFDALVLFKNLKSEFKEEWHWTSEEGAGYADYAWLQDFLDGYQYGNHKSDACRCRAVRRVAI